MRRPLAVLAAGLAALLCAPAAQARTYEVAACGSGAAGFTAVEGLGPGSPTGTMLATQSCPAGEDFTSGLSTRDASPPAGGAAGFLAGAYQTFSAPAGLTLRSISFRPAFGRTATTWTTALVGYDGEFNGADARVLWGLGANDAQGTRTATGFADPVTVELGALRNVRFETRCGALTPEGQPSSCPTGAAPSAWMAARDVVVQVTDDAAPRIAQLGGPLFDPGPRTGTQDLTVLAGDEAGIATATVRVDGRELASSGNGCPRPLDQPRCRDADLRLTVDLGDVPVGPRTVEVEVTDPAGNVQRTSRAIEVGFGPPAGMIAGVFRRGAQCPVVRDAAGRRRRPSPCLTAKTSAAYGKPVPIAGALAGADGAPLGNRRVVVETKARAVGADWVPAGETTTDPTGAFLYSLPIGPSRFVRTRFEGTARNGPASAEVFVSVRARTSIRIDRRRLRPGGTLRLSGTLRLANQFIQPPGKLVELQALDRRRWRTFKTVRTNQRGAWATRYRFGTGAGAATYGFRAVVPREAAFPFETGVSQRRVVKVR